MTNKELFDKFKFSSPRMLTNEFLNSSASGDIETIEYLLKQKDNPDTNENTDQDFIFDYNNSSLGDMNYSIIDGFVTASANGQIEIMKYFINSFEVDIDTKNYALTCAVENNHLDSVKYLLTSPELKEHANVYYDDENVFKQANLLRILDNNAIILEYLIFDFKIEETDSIKAYLQRSPNSEVESMFKVRTLNEQLENKLTDNLIKSNKIKL